MIVPTPEHDPLFADDGAAFRVKMLRYIRQEFADILGSDAALLDDDKGLDKLSQTYVWRTTDRRDVRRVA